MTPRSDTRSEAEETSLSAPRSNPLLPPQQMRALRNLERKQAGAEVEWINIADARAISDLGLARRTSSGWKITAAGLGALAGADAGYGRAAPSENSPC